MNTGAATLIEGWLLTVGAIMWSRRQRHHFLHLYSYISAGFRALIEAPQNSLYLDQVVVSLEAPNEAVCPGEETK